MELHASRFAHTAEKVYTVNGWLFVSAQLSTNWNGGGVSTRASNGGGRGDVGTFRGASVSLGLTALGVYAFLNTLENLLPPEYLEYYIQQRCA